MQTFTAIEYLQIDVANHMGLDKKTWNERLEWFKANEDKLEELLPEAKEPAMYLASVKAYRSSCNGEVNYFPISLDATSSGTQLQACALGDPNTAKMCNVLDAEDGSRADYYQLIYRQLKENFQGDYSAGDVKKALMTWGYASDAVPAETFSEHDLEVFLQGIDKLAPAISQIRQVTLDLWNENLDRYDWVLPDLFHAHFDVMVQNSFHFDFLGKRYQVTKNMKGTKANGRSLGPNLVHSIDALIVREMQRRCMYSLNKVNYVKRVIGNVDGTERKEPEITQDRILCAELWDQYKQTDFLSARILDHITPETVDIVDVDVIKEFIDSLPKKPFHITSVHDCFRCLPNYGNDLRKQYNICLAQVAKGNLFQKVFREATKNESITIIKEDPDMWKKVLDANYALS